MIPVDVVSARLVAALPTLAGRIGTALQFSAAMHTGALGQVDFSAYLLGLGFQGGPADMMANLFRQRLDRVLGVVLVRRAIADPLGSDVADAFADDVEAVIRAIAGWAPADDVGVFEVSRGELVSVLGGVATFQIDFRLNTQLRITV